MKRFWLILMLCAGTFGAIAQSYLLERELGTVSADGFYRVDITPDIIRDLNAGLSNVRIVDATGKEVPYVLRQEQPASYSKVFRAYQVVRYDKVKNCCSSIVLANPDHKTINNIHLSIRNADVSKAMILTGSDDQLDWYALKSKSTISAAGDGHHTSTMNLVDFPTSNYAYYKIDIDDSTSAPLNITAAGYFEVNTAEGKYSAVPFKWVKSDSVETRQTIVKIRFDGVQLVDRIALSMKGSAYFLRNATLLKEVRSEKAHAQSYFERVASFTISSKHRTVIDLAATRGDAFAIEIDNEDNPALDVQSVQVDQLNRYLVAWLNEGQGYTLKFGAQNLSAPRYDLVNFSDSIPSNIPSIKAGPLKGIKQVQVAESATFFTSGVIIWVAIILVIGILGFMAFRMMKEM